MNNYCKFLSRKRSGFTLVEVITASIMTMVTVTIAGYGIVIMTRSNVKTALESELQNTTNMAMEFVVAEVKRSQKIETDNLSNEMSSITSKTTGYTLPSGKEGVFALEMDSLEESIVYFTAPLNSSSPRWLIGKPGQLALYRWGPPPLSNGEYEHPDDATNWGKPVIIIDALSSISVDSNGKLAQISVIAESHPKSLGDADKTTYEVNTQVYARSSPSPSPSP